MQRIFMLGSFLIVVIQLIGICLANSNLDILLQLKVVHSDNISQSE